MHATARRVGADDDESVRNVGTWITRLGIAGVWIDILHDRAREMKRGVGITALLLGEWVLCFPMFFFRAGAAHFLLWVLFLLVAGATKLRKTKEGELLAQMEHENPHGTSYFYVMTAHRRYG